MQLYVSTCMTAEQRTYQRKYACAREYSAQLNQLYRGMQIVLLWIVNILNYCMMLLSYDTVCNFDDTVIKTKTFNRVLISSAAHHALNRRVSAFLFSLFLIAPDLALKPCLRQN